jgi:5-(carboxyamino)imidazole ribonucleotide synthase
MTAPDTKTALPPGSTIGILGDGQLGRMLAIAAAQLGYHVHIYAPSAPGVAGELAHHATGADYDDRDGLIAFARNCDVISFEFENIPVHALDALAPRPLFPPAMALDIAQDRLAEKRFAEAQGFKAAPFCAVNSHEDVVTAADKLGLPLVLKTRRLGYDGKGQARVAALDDVDSAWDAMKGTAAIAEAWIAHQGEFSVILVRGQDGEIRYWDSAENVHEDGILARSTVPAPTHMASAIAAARPLCAQMAEALNYVGVMTCEFFVGPDGPIFNEMAPRVHNSGHWTIEGAVTSQFENHIRAVCGLPLGDTALTGKQVEMINLIGDAANSWKTLLSDPTCHLHLYAKGHAVPGRKMGHATWVRREILQDAAQA